MVPVGSAHSGFGNILPGAAHFLEHMMITRSEDNSQHSEFDLCAGMTGGWMNAHTSLLWTTYEMSVPNQHLETMLIRLCSAIFKPLFTEPDMEQQRGVISNEHP